MLCSKQYVSTLKQSHAWKYLAPARFWPKGISYFPVEDGVKVNKYPGFEKRHQDIVTIYLHKLFKARIFYRQVPYLMLNSCQLMTVLTICIYIYFVVVVLKCLLQI